MGRNLFTYFKEQREKNQPHLISRVDFINSIGKENVWGKEFDKKTYLNFLNQYESLLKQYYLKLDPNFILNTRRSNCIERIRTSIQLKDLPNAMWAFWEFLSDDYGGAMYNSAQKLHKSLQECIKMDDEYRKAGMICEQEKQELLKLISEMKEFIHTL